MSKICHLTSVHVPFDNRIFEKQCKSIKAAGHDITLVAVYEKDEVVDGIPIKAVPAPRGRLERVFLTAWRVIRRGLAEDADLYQIHDPELLPWTLILRLRGKRVIYDMHENVPAAISTKFWLHPVIRKPLAWFYRTIEPLIVGNIPIIFAEESYRKDYQWVKNYEFVFNMPDLNVLLGIQTDSRFEVPTVGYMGDVTEDRGSMVTLEALRILKEQGLQVNWECVGQRADGYDKLTDDLVEKYQLSGVHFHGFQRPKVGWSIMARCHIGLVLLQPLPNYMGSAPTKTFEYMALGLPQIGPDIPLYRELIEGASAGICVDSTDPQAIAEAIRYLLEHPAMAEEMGKRGREIVQQKYNWEAEAKKLLDLYRRTLQGASSVPVRGTDIAG